MAAVLTYSDYWLPPTSIPVPEFVDRINYPAADKSALSRTLSETLGFEGIRIDDRAQEADHFSILLDRYFSATDTLPEDIGYIIYTRGISVATGDPWSKKDLPCVNVPYFLHNKYGLQAEIFNVEQECSGSLVAIKIGAALLAGQEAKKILVLSSNYFETLDKRLMGDMILVSDGLGVMEIATGGGGLQVIDHAAVTDGGISRVMDFNADVNFQRMIELGCSIIRDLISRNGMSLSDVALIIPQNISEATWHFYCHRLKMSPSKVFLENCGGVGHLGDVDIIRNITDARKRNRLKQGDHAIIYGVGTGSSWNALLVRAS
jgi:3-oxoacyl-[acyl-carrier-protein] synthase III